MEESVYVLHVFQAQDIDSPYKFPSMLLWHNSGWENLMVHYSNRFLVKWQVCPYLFTDALIDVTKQKLYTVLPSFQ